MVVRVHDLWLGAATEPMNAETLWLWAGAHAPWVFRQRPRKTRDLIAALERQQNTLVEIVEGAR